jgi:hypothetical protein
MVLFVLNNMAKRVFDREGSSARTLKRGQQLALLVIVSTTTRNLTLIRRS